MLSQHIQIHLIVSRLYYFIYSLMRTNTVTVNHNISVSLVILKNLSIFTSTRPCRVLHTSVRSTPHERAQYSTRACGDLDTNVWRQANNYVWKCETKQSF